MEWYDVTRGASRAGELLAVFELLEYPSTKDYGFPTLPDPKDPSCGSQTPGSGQDQGPILPVPVGIRPTLAKYRYIYNTINFLYYLFNQGSFVFFSSCFKQRLIVKINYIELTL